MMLTPEEARKKWCPFARSITDYDSVAVINRTLHGKADAGSLCLADGCMAWREEVLFIPKAGAPSVTKKTGRGCCGLAGLPK